MLQREVDGFVILRLRWPVRQQRRAAINPRPIPANLFSDSSPAIGRTLIPRYFRSIFDGGVTDLYYTLKHPRESFHNTSITLECECCTMVTHHGKPMYTKVSSSRPSPTLPLPLPLPPKSLTPKSWVDLGASCSSQPA